MDLPVVVAAAVIEQGKKILIAKRKNDTFWEPNKWELPGGKIEFLESPEEALMREVKEELGVIIKPGELISVGSHVYNKKGKKLHVILLLYKAEVVKGKPKCIECQETRWVHVGEIGKFDFIEADKEKLKTIYKRIF